MPDIHFYGFGPRALEQAKKDVREQLRNTDYAGKLNLVSDQSETEGLVDGKTAPFLRIQGRKTVLDEISGDIAKRLTNLFDIEIAYNEQWIPRKR